MTDRPAQRALAASALSLLLACAAAAAFLPPLAAQTLASGLRTLAMALVLGGGLLAHWIWLGVAARRLERSVAGWVGLAVGLTPVGGVAALSLLGLVAADGAAAPARGRVLPSGA